MKVASDLVDGITDVGDELRELLQLGIDIGETSVSKYMVRGSKPPSQTWRTFLGNHLKTVVSVDFLSCPLCGSRSSTYFWFWLTIVVGFSILA
jgi:hypothetical protein